MRRIMLVVPAVVCALYAQDDLLTLDTVLRLKAKGLGDEVILTTIKTAKAVKIDTSALGLIAMKDGGLSDAVIKAVQDRQSSLEVARAGNETGRISPTEDIPAGLPAELGVHYKSEKGWIRLDQVTGKRQIQRKSL